MDELWALQHSPYMGVALCLWQRQRGCWLPTLAETDISELLLWAAEAGRVLMWEIRNALNPLFPLCSSQAMLQFDLKSVARPSVSVTSTISDMGSFSPVLPPSPSLQQVCQHAYVNMACAGLFCSWPRYKQRPHFVGSVWNDSRVSYRSSVIFLNLVTQYVWVVQRRAECLCQRCPPSGCLVEERWNFIPLLCLPSWGGAHYPSIPGS